MAIGGTAAPVVTSGTTAVLDWLGPEPEQGFATAFEGSAPQGVSGPWRLLRFLDGLRPRDWGRRYLVEVRLAEARVYL